jgi:hypothetical protein
MDPKDVGHLHTLKPWAVYTFVLFQDAAAEPDGESFMMWHAVSAHIPLEEQSKPRAWLTIGIAAKLSFETSTIAALQESVTLRANCEAAYDDAVLGELFRIGAGGVAVRQRWDADVEMPTMVVTGIHALVLDNPQQAAVLGVTGCPYCIHSNRWRAFFGRAPDTRSKASMQPVLMAAHDAMQNARGPRDLEMRVAKKNLARLGLRWPPKPQQHPDGSDRPLASRAARSRDQMGAAFGRAPTGTGAFPEEKDSRVCITPAARCG